MCKSWVVSWQSHWSLACSATLYVRLHVVAKKLHVSHKLNCCGYHTWHDHHCILYLQAKVRRLYDIANVLTSLALIKKVHVTEERGRKPAFKWIGPVDFSSSGKEHDCAGDLYNFKFPMPFFNSCVYHIVKLITFSHNPHHIQDWTGVPTLGAITVSLQMVCDVGSQSRNENFHDLQMWEFYNY